jgi:hypothetical protein
MRLPLSRIALLTAVSAIVLGVGGAASAEAAVTCSFNGGALSIRASAPIDSPAIVRSGNVIVVKGSANPVTCTGAAPTVTNTHLITYSDDSSGETYFQVDLRGGPFSPGQTNEPGDSDEIDIQAFMGAGNDRLYVWGGPGGDFWRTGSTPAGIGFNLNTELETSPGEANSDIDLRDAELLVLMPGAGSDRVFAGGGPEFTGPVPVRIDLNAEEGNDQVIGGSGSDHFLDGVGDLTVNGGAGDDLVSQYGPDTGDDVIDGGPGSDDVAWSEVAAGDMRVDLRLTGPQDTGAGGRDTLTNVENLGTSEGEDVLIGTDGPNGLNGGEGDDLIAGLGGNDRVHGDNGRDTASYAITPAGGTAGVFVNLSMNDVDQDTRGAGIDRLTSVEGVVGSPFPDLLIGSAGPNSFDVRDGKGDRVDCRDGEDRVVADAEGIDALTLCESAEFDVRPDTRIEGAPASLLNDRTPSFRLVSSKPGSSYECSLDGGPFAVCPAPYTAPALGDGAHTLKVRARDRLGVLDLSAAEHTFSIDATAPRIRRPRLSRAGLLRYRLSEKAAVRISVHSGRRSVSIRRAAGAGPNQAALARSIRRAARGGTARIAISAVDVAGNLSVARLTTR